MAKQHKTKQGDSIDSIAYTNGFYWETIWNHPDNVTLKNSRKDSDILYPGDLVTIPDLELRNEAISTESKHTFRRKGVPAWLCLTFENEDEPRSGELYKIQIDGVSNEGALNSEGMLEIQIQPNAIMAKVWIGNDEPINFVLGSLDPIDKIEGVQIRLSNLGFYEGEVDGDQGPQTEAAIKGFQKKSGLKATGLIDDKTKETIEMEHDLK